MADNKILRSSNFYKKKKETKVAIRGWTNGQWRGLGQWRGGIEELRTKIGKLLLRKHTPDCGEIKVSIIVRKLKGA